ncbi:MAG: phosphoglycerate dehydrogenase [Anaerolineaceae bacterium]|nr:MAG: phosphoglycerate dehydrogenase [Anaerolineaceae bacterium]
MTADYHIIIATDLTDESLKTLHESDDVLVTFVAPHVQAIRDVIADAHALIARDDVRIDADMIDAAPLLRVIGHPAAGISGVDIEAATRRGIMVMNTPGVSAVAAAEHTMTLMLALSRRLVDAHNSMRAGYWLLDRRRQAGNQLRDKTLGIIGLGRVGQIVAGLALAFGMNVLAYDPYITEEQVADGRVQLSGLRDLLERSDFVSLHVPETRETRGMIDAERVAQMKAGARLINNAYGGAMDEQAVVDALQNGRLAGVAVDVYPDEPPYNSPLIGVEGVIHTPHIGDNTVEAKHNLSMQIVQQVIDALRDDDYRNVINLPLVPGRDYESVRPYMVLAERIGIVLHTLARSPVGRVAVELRGDEASGLVKPVTVALLKGLLSPVLGDNVSYINAPFLAHERGLHVYQAKNLPTVDYANLVSCKVTLEDGEEIVMAGTLLDRRVPHIMQINEYRMNFVPQGHLLLMGSYDRPGVIGRVGTLMATNQVNIASWQTGRAQPGGQTLTVLTLDDSLPSSVLEALRGQEFVRHAHQVDF